ncbi:MAG: AMP-binding protein [Bacilli bacterium]|nr:AMP-binding protein [Bacilli bacterium]
MGKTIKAPWYQYYDQERQHLEYPNFSAYKLIEYTASKHLTNISYNYYGNKKTYYEFLKQIDEVARAFKALGVKHKDVVSICMPNTPEGIISFYAVNKIGAIASMIHPLSAENEIKHYLNISKTEWLICVDFAYEKVERIIKETKVKKSVLVGVGESMPPIMKSIYAASNVPKSLSKTINNLNPLNYINVDSEVVENNKKRMGWKEFIRLGKDYTKEIDDDFKGKEIAAILYSGGTTGTPKGVKLTNLNLNASAMQNFEHVGCLRDKDKVLAIMPIFHGFGLAVCIHCVQYFGGTSILLPQFDARTFEKIMKKYEPNVIVGVPTLFEAMLSNKNFRFMRLDYLTCVISGGDTLSIDLKNRFDEWLKKHHSNTTIREGYGLTECCAASCFTPLHHYRPGSIGIPYPDMYYKIVEDGTEKEVPYGQEGEIVITGPTIMDGYIHNRKETKQTLRKHRDGHIWLHTGDQGIMDKDGFVYFKGRLKRMIISSGYNIYPTNIENVIDSHPEVKTSCVIGIPHPYKVMAAKAFIVLNNPHKESEETLNSIKSLVEKNLARFSWPVAYEFRKELPKTLVGKVAYNVLIHEEKMKADKPTWEKDNDLLEQVEDETNSNELIDNLKKDKED